MLTAFSSKYPPRGEKDCSDENSMTHSVPSVFLSQWRCVCCFQQSWTDPRVLLLVQLISFWSSLERRNQMNILLWTLNNITTTLWCCVSKGNRLNLKDKSFILASCEFIFVDMKFYTHSYKNTLLFYFIILFCYFSKHFQRMRHVLKKSFISDLHCSQTVPGNGHNRVILCMIIMVHKAKHHSD